MSSRPSTPTFHDNKPIDPEQFAQAWNAYTQAHPHDIIVVNAMHRAVPTLVSGTHYKMKSANEGEAGMINNSLTSILTHLRNTLQNGTITLEIELVKIADASGNVVKQLKSVGGECTWDGTVDGAGYRSL